MKRSWIETLLLGVVFATVTVAIVAYVLFLRPFRVPSSSMAPMIPNGAHVWMLRTKAVQRGDLVVFRYPADRRTTLVKRAVAIGGDTVEIRAKTLLLNGKPLNEPYAVHTDETTYPRLTLLPEPYRSRDNLDAHRVAPGSLFVLGDNRDQSNDSRYFGDVSRDDVMGRVVLIIDARGIRRVGR